MLLLQGRSVGRGTGLVLVHPIPGGFSGGQAFFAAYLCMQFVFENEACCQVKAGEMGVQLGWGGSGGREEQREGGRRTDSELLYLGHSPQAEHHVHYILYTQLYCKLYTKVYCKLYPLLYF